ncbi:hypothetical protein D9757_009485 [Collybiopsis confluens]|uniref:Uncharacterized protein n=1 Tax=Collybiopsis confluens TaxID=2823264 RepID=A0A8H5H537_9AGAR|nr:hypothetical protein D9757_009485 [Collybiopsis confluens]
MISQNVSLNVSNNYEHRASGHPCDSETQRTQRASLSMDISAENMSSIGGSQITSDTDNANNNRNGDFKDVCVQNSNYGININIINTQFPGMGLGLASAVSLGRGSLFGHGDSMLMSWDGYYAVPLIGFHDRPFLWGLHLMR